jgi:ABC-type multidrug transport system fused ATPase/permease subunit
MPSLPREWAWLWREVRPFALHQSASLACIILSNVPGLAGPLLMKWIVDDIVPSKRWGALAAVTGLFFMAEVTRPALSQLGGVINTVAISRMTFRTRSRLIAHVQRLSADFHAHYAVGELMQRLERDVALVGELGADVLPSLMRVVFGLAMTTALMIYLDWRLSAIILPLLPLLTYVRHRYRIKLQRGAEAVRDAAGRQSNHLHEMLLGAVQVQLLGAEGRLARRYAILALKTMKAQVAQRKSESLFMLASMCVVACGVALIIGYGGTRVMLGQLSIGGLVAISGYLGALFVPLNIAAEFSSKANRVRASIRRLIEIEEVPAGIRDAPDAVPLQTPPAVLACRGVSFRYGDGTQMLRHVDFRVQAGERVVIVGESGCGKSTLLKLMSRLYDPAEGSVHVDGRDLREVRLESVRRMISYVPQHPVLFQGTIRDNLRYAAPAATADEIAHAASIACLTDVVDGLPAGLDTPLGPMGEGLSGGEKQRLAIARALLHQRPILFLDEAASALDAATERQLFARLRGWCAGRIVVVVTHRLSVARWGDRVVVLRRGELVEDSTHSALDRRGTHYSALWNGGGTPSEVDAPVIRT